LAINYLYKPSFKIKGRHLQGLVLELIVEYKSLYFILFIIILNL